MGYVVAPPLDLTASEHYNMGSLRLLEWAIHMIEDGRFRSFLTEPPCTSFSPAAHPCVRSYKQPLGFCRKEKKTFIGNLHAFRSFILLKVGHRKSRPCGLENPRLSKMAWLDFWRTLLEIGFEEAVIASCQFGSIHKKEFRFLLYLVSAAELDVRCPGGHSHVRIEGKWTKGSAVYTDELGKHLAIGFAKALDHQRWVDQDALLEPGFENPVINDILSAGLWTLERAWTWRKHAHVNVYEIESAVSQQSLEEPGTRFAHAVDSAVAMHALAKGRSSSYRLQPALKRSAAVQLAFDTYPASCFAPTRLNVADDPTRDLEIRESCSRSFIGLFDAKTLRDLCRMRLKRSHANWVRLCILLTCLPCCEANSTPSSAEEGQWMLVFLDSLVRLSQRLWVVIINPAWGFGLSLLGSASVFLPERLRFCMSIPAQGVDFSLLCSALWWVLVLVVLVLGFLAHHYRSCSVKGPSWTFVLLSDQPASRPSAALAKVVRKNPKNDGGLSKGIHVALFSLLLLGAPQGSVAAMEATTAAEKERVKFRSSLNLPSDRLLKRETRNQRRLLVIRFRTWLWKDHGISLRGLLDAKPIDPERISHWLAVYGKEMYLGGRSYGQFSETINAIAMMKPLIRKQLTPAWDVAYAWLVDEPHQHHPALPVSVFLALLSLSILWGWPYEAAVISLAWAGILRIGEVLQSCRRDLVLPSDSVPGFSFILLKIKEAKTRGRSAKHQSARVDQPDLIDLISAVYGPLKPDEPLWPWSAATLRKRFNLLLEELGLPTKRCGQARPFDLASLRPGGATWLLHATENSEIVRRRGRWLSSRVMEIYLQEVLVATFLVNLDPDVRQNIESLALGFEKLAQIAVSFLSHAIPSKAWNSLLKGKAGLGSTGKDGKSFGQNGPAS